MPDNIPKFLGVVLDPRSEVKKAQDFPHEETLPAAAPEPVVWTEKPSASWRRFPKRDQNGSSSCMAHSGAKALGVENVVEENTFVELSALPTYRSRSNFPGEGMYQQDLFSLLSKPTACLESQKPSMGLTETVMNQPVTLSKEERAKAEYYRSGGYFFFTNLQDIDAIARVIDQGKAVHLLMFFLPQEYWQNVPKVVEPELVNSGFDTRIQRHGITIVDRTLWNGEKAFIIEDSAGGESTIDQTGQRVVTESFFKARCYGAGYLIFRQNSVGAIEKPVHRFTRSLYYGLRGDGEVTWLQKVLQYEGHLALTIDGQPLPYGNMLQMTCTALKKWQLAHGITDFATEPDVRKVRFGPKSIGLANILYAQ